MAVPLLSADFLASSFLTDEILIPLLHAAEAGELLLFPVLSRDVDLALDPVLSRLKLVHRNGRSLHGLRTDEREKALVALSMSILDAVKPPQGAGYLHDLFLSYHRGGEVPAWVRGRLIDAVELALRAHLPRAPRILDLDQAAGEIGAPLQRSRCLLAIWSPEYFLDERCRMELDSMRAREALIEGTPLIHRVIFSDCEEILRAEPQEHSDLRRFTYVHPPSAPTRREGDYRAEIQRLARRVAHLIEQAPAWRSDWPIVSPGPLQAPRRIRKPRL